MWQTVSFGVDYDSCECVFERFGLLIFHNQCFEIFRKLDADCQAEASQTIPGNNRCGLRPQNSIRFANPAAQPIVA
jgi:hypothetical protein